MSKGLKAFEKDIIMRLLLYNNVVSIITCHYYTNHILKLFDIATDTTRCPFNNRIFYNFDISYANNNHSSSKFTTNFVKGALTKFKFTIKVSDVFSVCHSYLQIITNNFI